MSQHVERLKQVVNLLDETQNDMAAVGVDKAVEYLESVEQQLAAAEQREAVLRECVHFYADKRQWVHRVPSLNRKWFCGLHEHGYEPAQAALARVGQLKGEGISLASDIGHAEGQM